MLTPEEIEILLMDEDPEDDADLPSSISKANIDQMLDAIARPDPSKPVQLEFDFSKDNDDSFIALSGKEIIDHTFKIIGEGKVRELFPYIFMTTLGPDGKVQKNEMEERSWKEDFNQENGRYLSRCCVCENEFVGHKRRVVCKQCKSKTA